MAWAIRSADGMLQPSSSRAVGAYLGPPYRYVRKSLGLDPLSLLMEAESMLKFHTPGAEAAVAQHNHARVLQLMPGELPLHYKVWQLLLATRRQEEATAHALE